MELTVTFVVLSVLYHLGNSEHAVDDLTKDIVSSCQVSSGVTDAEAEELMESKIVQDESNDRQKCFIVCLFTKYGVMQEDKMNTELLVAVLKETKPEGSKEKEEQYRKDIDECNQAGSSEILTSINTSTSHYHSGEGKCERSYNIWKCFFEMSIKFAIADMAEQS